MMTGIGIVIGIVLIVLAAIYGIIKLILGAIRFIGGTVVNAADKVRNRK